MSIEGDGHACEVVFERVAHRVLQLLGQLGVKFDMRFAVVLEFGCQHSQQQFVVSNADHDNTVRMYQDGVERAARQGPSPRTVHVSLEGEPDIVDAETGEPVAGVPDIIESVPASVHFGTRRPSGRA